jgi:tetratricopeptide (TPR) repeat protein
MRTRFALVSKLLLASIFVSPAALANEEPRYEPPAAWVETPNKPLPTGKPQRNRLFLINEMQTNITAGRQEVFTDIAYHVPSAELLNQLGTLTLQWQPDRGDMIVHRAELLRGTETIDLLASGKRPNVLRREAALEQNAIDGMLTATMPIEGLRVGDIVRFSTTTVMTNPSLPQHGEAQFLLPTVEQPVPPATYRLIWPDSMAMRWKVRGEKIAAAETTANGQRELRITLPAPKQREMPDDAPPRFRMPPMVQVSSLPSWSELSRLHAPAYAVAGTIADGSPLAAAADAIAKAHADPKARMIAALQLVQREVRYLYNGLGTGNFEPQAPAATWEMRSGDCKAKTKLLLALLDRLGIAAQPVLVHSSNGDLLAEILPAMGVFDHVIVRAQLGDRDYWLDGTTSGALPENIDDVPAFRSGLPLVAAGSELVILPPRAPSTPEFAIDLTFDQSAGIVYPVLVTGKLVAKAPLSDVLRNVQTRANDEQMRDFMQQTFGELVGNGQIFEHSMEFDETNGSATISLKALGNKMWDRGDGPPRHEVGGTVSDFTFAPDRSKAAWKEIPVLRVAERDQLVRHFILPGKPEDFTVEGSDPVALDVGGIQLTRAVARSGNRISVTETQASGAGEIAVADIPAVRTAAAEAGKRPLRLRARAGYPERWQELLATRNSKKLDPLIAAYQAAIDRDPEEVTGYNNRAVFYRGLYRYEDALKDAGRAVELADDAASRLQRGSLYAQIGKFDEAIADFDAALAEDPANDSAIAYKAETLRRMGRGDEAIALIEEQLEGDKAKRGTWLGYLAELQAYDGQMEEAVASADLALSEEPDSPTALNGRCWIKGLVNRDLDAALADCTRAVSLVDNAAATLDSRALIHYRAGRYKEALADYDAALKLAPGKASSLFMRGVVRIADGRKADGEGDIAAATVIEPLVALDFSAWGIRAPGK